MEWNKLSMADRAKYIKLAVNNGVTDLSQIRDIYNKYAEGGDLYSTETITDTPYKGYNRIENMSSPVYTLPNNLNTRRGWRGGRS